jgi:hypothetical protein
MNTHPDPPLVFPDPPDLSRALTRAATAAVPRIDWQAGSTFSAEDIIAQRWPDDRAAPSCCGPPPRQADDRLGQRLRDDDR